MTNKEMTSVPKGKVLVTSSSDWFTNETYFTVHPAGAQVSCEAMTHGRLLNDGESVEVTESLRNDGPGEPRDHTFTHMRITNQSGKGVSHVLRRWRA